MIDNITSTKHGISFMINHYKDTQTALVELTWEDYLKLVQAAETQLFGDMTDD